MLTPTQSRELAIKLFVSRLSLEDRFKLVSEFEAGSLNRSASWNEADHPRGSDGKFGSISGLLDVMGNKAALNEAVSAVAAKIDLPDGVSVKSARAAGTRGDWWKLELQDADGNSIAQFSRKIKRDSDGNPYVMHATADVEPQWQKKGIASAVNREFENWYKQSGVDTVKLEASGGSDFGFVGGYVWARAGYDWDQGTDKETLTTAIQRMRDLVTESGNSDLVEKANDLLTQVASSDKITDWPTPAELAAFGRIPGVDTWPGKQVMSGTTWNGRKRLV